MDQNSTASPDWGTMGGTMGDGLMGGSAAPTPPPVPAAVVPQPPPQQQQSFGSAAPQGYAARAAAAHASYQATQNANVPSVQTTPSAPAGGSYAARSAQAYAQQGGYPQPQQQQQQQQPPSYGGGGYGQPASYGGAPPQSPYGMPQQQQQQQQQFGSPQPQSYSQSYGTPQQASPAPHTNFSPGYGGASAYTQQPQQQQQQQQQQVQTQPSPAASPARPPANQGSYAARSAQAYAATTPPPQPPPQGYASAAASTITSVPASTASPYNTLSRAANGPQPQPGYPTTQGAMPQSTSGMATQSASQSPAVQKRFLDDATRKVQEHAYYMKQAMEQHQLPTVLERAAYMVGELGGLPHGSSTSATGVSLSNTGLSVSLTPKNYYELYMRALEDLPTLEEYLLGLAQKPEISPLAHPTEQAMQETAAAQEPSMSMRELYDCAQYCPRVLPRLYLQITAGSALIRSGETGAKFVMDDLLNAVKCEQNPMRGLFLRHYLLTALRDKLPDGPAVEGEENADTTTEQAPGTVVDSYEFVLANFMEMNKLWVRLQHMPGEVRREVRERRARERNDLRLLVGTNLVRLSQLEGVTSKIYGERILTRILEHVVKEGDPLSQAYLMDCLVQVFPDEYHIETMPILLGVCPRLRDKVNIRTILLGLMDRLANYLAEEELLDESDTNQVKLTLARDSFGMFEDCVQKVYNARGPKLTAKEVIRLQTALLQFSLRCYPGNMEQITTCMSACVSALHQANASYEMTEATVATVPKQLDEVAVKELEKLLSIPLESLALRVLQLPHFGQLISFLPWSNRKGVAIKFLEAVDQAGRPPQSTAELEQLFQLILPLLRDQGAPGATMVAPNTPTAQATSLMANLGVSTAPAPAFESSFVEDGATPVEQVEQEAALVSKLIFLLDHPNTDILYEMMLVARRGVQVGGRRRLARILASIAVAGLKLARRLAKPETEELSVDAPTEPDTPAELVEEGVDEPKEGSDEPKAEASDAPENGVSEEPKSEAAEEGSTIVDAAEETKFEPEPEVPEERKISCRQVFIFVQETIRNLGKANAEAGVKMYLEAALVADTLAQQGEPTVFSPISYEMLSQAYSLYEGSVSDSVVQLKCVTAIIGTLMACGGLTESDYESLITKSAQLSAKLVKKPDQCRMVALCAHLFFPASKGESFGYRNAQRSLECLQRSLKLADSCTTANSANVELFVELLEHYLYLFEKKSPTISAGYITGLVSLIKEHLNNLSGSVGVMEAKNHFMGIIREIKRKKEAEKTSAYFADVQVTA